MRLIDVDELLHDTVWLCGGFVGDPYSDGYMEALDNVETVIREFPTVDAVEVVRCKDCIHYDFGVCLKIYSDGAVSQYAWQARKEDDFCSYGEKKTNPEIPENITHQSQ